MHARDLLVPLPVASATLSVRDAARLLADQPAPGLIVTDESGAVVGAVTVTQLLRMAMPAYLSQAPGLTRAFDDASVASIVDECVSRTVGSCLSREHQTSPAIDVESRLLEIAELMARTDLPIVAVADPSQAIVGAVTADAVMRALVQPERGHADPVAEHRRSGHGEIAQPQVRHAERDRDGGDH